MDFYNLIFRTLNKDLLIFYQEKNGEVLIDMMNILTFHLMILNLGW